MDAPIEKLPLLMLPSVGYLAKILSSNHLIFSKGERWEKQTSRSRFDIAGPNGKQTLSIPLVHSTTHATISEVQIDYSQNWQSKHWRSIETAYNKAPFFEFYEHYFNPLFTNKFHLLAEFNLQALHAILRALKVKRHIEIDTLPHPSIIVPEPSVLPQYNQVFIEKNGFISNLSILDLIFNEGPNAMDCFI